MNINKYVDDKKALFWKFQGNSSIWSQNIEQKIQFEVSIGLWPLILIISTKQALFWKFQGNSFKWTQNIEQNIHFWG